MTHIIRQQYLQVELIGSEYDGFALQRRLSAICNDWLVPALERVLDRLAPQDAHLYIEHLELDAGFLSLDRLEHDLMENVAMAIEKAIKELIVPGEARAINNKATFWNNPIKTETQNIVVAFLYFLDTGRLPWSFRLPVRTSLESLIFDHLFSQDQLIQVKKRLSLPSVQQRLINQFSIPFLESFLNQLSSEGQTLFKQIVFKLRSVDVSINQETQVERPVDLPPSQATQVEKKLIALIFAQIAKGSGLSENDMVAALVASLPPQEWMTSLKQQWPHLDIKPSVQKVKNKDKKYHEDRLKSRQKEWGFSLENAIDLKQEEIKGIYIDNAGLVLLHPFLPRFFEALGIVQQEELLDPNRALTLLHFLTTGQTNAPEYELVLPKILCNLPLETPVETNSAITNTEKEESEALLSAVIRHWNVLGDSSPDALRGTFLCRAGKVSRRDDNDWLLQVEYQSFDVLLDHLPWGISMIKLPWMDNMIWVEWV